MKRHFVIVMEAIETWLADSDRDLRTPDIPHTYEIDCLRREKTMDKFLAMIVPDTGMKL